MTFLEHAQHDLQIKQKIKINKGTITLFGMNIFTVCHSAGIECHLHLDKTNQSTPKLYVCSQTRGGIEKQDKVQVAIKTMI